MEPMSRHNHKCMAARNLGGPPDGRIPRRGRSCCSRGWGGGLLWGHGIEDRLPQKPCPQVQEEGTLGPRRALACLGGRGFRGTESAVRPAAATPLDPS